MPEHCNINIAPFFQTRLTGASECPEGISSERDLSQRVPELPERDWLQQVPGLPVPLLEWRVPVLITSTPVPAKRVQNQTKWIPVHFDCCPPQSRPFPVQLPYLKPTENRKRFEPSEPGLVRTYYCPTESDWRIEERRRPASSPIPAVRAVLAAARKELRYSRKLPADWERTSDTPAQQAESRTRFAFGTRRFHRFRSRPLTDPASLDAD